MSQCTLQGPNQIYNEIRQGEKRKKGYNQIQIHKNIYK